MTRIAYKTPPPRQQRVSKESSSSKPQGQAVLFRLKMRTDTVHDIKAENDGPGLKQADAILKQLKDLWGIIMFGNSSFRCPKRIFIAVQVVRYIYCWYF